MNSMKNWNVYLPNGEAVTVIGEIECREGKYYFKNGDDVVAVFNDDKVCGVLKEVLDGSICTPTGKPHNCLEHLGHEKSSTYDRPCMVCGRKVTGLEIASAPKRVVPQTVYPTGKEG
jgi:hypothetical protein